MQTRITDRPVHQAIAAIQALDLDPIRLRVMDKESGEGWTPEYAETIEQAYRTYLTMLVKHPEDAEDIVVSKDVDEFWHAHILHTMKYTEDCEKVFGTYLHHNPHVGERTQADIEKKAVQAEKTRRLYRNEYAGVQDVAYCGASVKARDAAYCGASVKAQDVAYCGASLAAREAAYCGASVKAQDVAYCGASLAAREAAYCGGTVSK
jgi:hypothetical protein